MTVPAVVSQTMLSPAEFRTGTCMRYYWTPPDLQPVCDGCAAKNFDMAHAFSCSNGGLMISTHDELKYTILELGQAALGASNVRDEPRTKLGRSIVSEGNQTKEEVQVDHQRRGDALLQGFWKGGTTCIVDNQFVYLDAPSYLDREPKAVLATREAAKKKKHRGDCALNRRHFTPFIASRDAILAKEANSFTRAMAAHLANKWRRAYSDICGYIKGRMGLTIIRASTRCLYGSRVPVRYISSAPEWSDGLGLGLWTTLSDSSISGTPPSAVRRAES